MHKTCLCILGCIAYIFIGGGDASQLKKCPDPYISLKSFKINSIKLKLLNYIYISPTKNAREMISLIVFSTKLVVLLNLKLLAENQSLESIRWFYLNVKLNA